MSMTEDEKCEISKLRIQRSEHLADNEKHVAIIARQAGKIDELLRYIAELKSKIKDQ